MIPLGDYNPIYSRPYITYGLIILNTLIFLWQTLLPQRELQQVFMDYSVVPLFISRDPFSLATLLDGLRSMFFHGSWAHLGFNMLYLWVFGDNIEDRLGKPLFIVVYLLCGYAAVFAQVLIDPQSSVPLVGASGAIAGVLGGYFILYPQAPIRSIVFYMMMDIPAVFVLGFWFVSQLFSGVASLGAQTGGGGGVAFFAHIGGFVAGMLILAAHRQVYGAPEITRRYNIARHQRTPRQKGWFARSQPEAQLPQTLIPLDLSPDERSARQARHFNTLNGLALGSKVWLLTEGTAYYGNLLALDPHKVTVQQAETQFIIPLENITKVG